MESVFAILRDAGEYQRLLSSIRDRRSTAPLRLPRAGRLAVLAALKQDLRCPVLLLTDRDDHALVLWEELAFWTRARRLHFAEPNPLYYERVPWSATVRRERLEALTSAAAGRVGDPISESEPPILVSSARALMTRTMPFEQFAAACRRLTPGMRVPPDALRSSLAEEGYERGNVVLEPGQFAIRGGILDVWAPATPSPVRLELVGDEIDSMRTFDPVTQRTIEVVSSLQLVPAREFLLRADAKTSRLVDAGVPPSEFHIPMLHPTSATLLDYLSPHTLVVIDDLSTIEGITEEIEHQAVDLRRAALEDGNLPADAAMPYVSWSELRDQLLTLPTLVLGRADTFQDSQGDSDLDLAATFGHDERFGGRLKPFLDYLGALGVKEDAVLVVSRQKARLEELWRESHAAVRDSASTLPAREPEFIEASLREGFVLPGLHLITDSEVFGWERPATRSRLRTAPEAPEFVYADLKPGDHVVHVDHGIARYVGLVRRNLDGREREYLELEYDGGGQLFVPVHQADRLTRYVGAEGLEPSLDRLGGQDWHERKARAQGAVVARLQVRCWNCTPRGRSLLAMPTLRIHHGRANWRQVSRTSRPMIK